MYEPCNVPFPFRAVSAGRVFFVFVIFIVSETRSTEDPNEIWSVCGDVRYSRILNDLLDICHGVWRVVRGGKTVWRVEQLVCHEEDEPFVCAVRYEPKGGCSNHHFTTKPATAELLSSLETGRPSLHSRPSDPVASRSDIRVGCSKFEA